MAVFIPKMEMPSRCGECPCFHADYPIYCQAVKADKAKRIDAPYGKPIPDWCPLEEQPEQKHGHWVLFRHPNLGLVYRCSVCKLCVYDKYKFCPHCGAKMDEEVHTDD